MLGILLDLSVNYKLLILMNVPFNNLYLQYLSLKEEIDSAINEVIVNSSFIRGKFVDEFEHNFANTVGVKNCVSCANGTDALFIAIKSLGVEENDEIIVPAHSWIATSEVVTLAGAKVVFCDTQKDTFTMCPISLESKLSSKTVGIIPVHLFGQSADMDEIMKVAHTNNLWVIEDCAQAHIACYKGKRVGSIGSVGTFSFYPGKNLGAMGDAGAIVTNDNQLAHQMASFARHGGLKKGIHEIEGMNSRMDGMQAAILGVKLPHLENWTKNRQEIAHSYMQNLANLDDIVLPQTSPFRNHVHHLFVIKSKNRDNLKSHLRDKGIQTVINYPIALPFLEAYSHLYHRHEEFPNAYKNQKSILSLPLFPEMNRLEIEYVVEAIKNF